MTLSYVIAAALIIFIAGQLFTHSKKIKETTKLYISLAIAIACLTYLYIDYFINRVTNLYYLLAFTLYIVSSFTYAIIKKKRQINLVQYDYQRSGN